MLPPVPCRLRAFRPTVQRQYVSMSTCHEAMGIRFLRAALILLTFISHSLVPRVLVAHDLSFTSLAVLCPHQFFIISRSIVFTLSFIMGRTNKVQVQEEQGPSHRGSAVQWRKQLAERLQLQRSKMDVPHIDEEGLIELPAPGLFLPLGAVPAGSETEQRAAVRNCYMLTATGYVPDRVTTFVSGRPVQAIAVNILVLHKYIIKCVLLLLHALVLALIAEGSRPHP